MFCQHMLTPLLTEKTIEDLVENSVFFSVTTDASNHSTFKVFPIISNYAQLECR